MSSSLLRKDGSVGSKDAILKAKKKTQRRTNSLEPVSDFSHATVASQVATMILLVHKNCFEESGVKVKKTKKKNCVDMMDLRQYQNILNLSMQLIEDEFAISKDTLSQSMSMFEFFGYLPQFKTNLHMNCQEQYEAYVQNAAKDTPFVQFEVRLKMRSGPIGSVKSSQVTKISKNTTKPQQKHNNMRGKILLDVNKPMTQHIQDVYMAQSRQSSTKIESESEFDRYVNLHLAKKKKETKGGDNNLNNLLVERRALVYFPSDKHNKTRYREFWASFFNLVNSEKNEEICRNQLEGDLQTSQLQASQLEANIFQKLPGLKIDSPYDSKCS